jgi:hypothetical protein
LAGALVVTGGTGIGGNISIGGNTNIGGSVNIGGNTIITGTLTYGTINSSTVTVQGAYITDSGFELDFTGIPSWARKFTLSYHNVSQNNAAATLNVQIAINGTYLTSGYQAITSQQTGATTSTNAVFIPLWYTTINASAQMNGVVNFNFYNSLSGFPAVNTIFVTGDLQTSSSTLTNIANGCFSVRSTQPVNAFISAIKIRTTNAAHVFTGGYVSLSYM